MYVLVDHKIDVAFSSCTGEGRRSSKLMVYPFFSAHFSTSEPFVLELVSHWMFLAFMSPMMSAFGREGFSVLLLSYPSLQGHLLQVFRAEIVLLSCLF